jgi:plasmid stability protein
MIFARGSAGEKIYRRDMTEITIRNLDDAQLVRLKRKAWEDGVPLEECLRRIILAGLERKESQPDAFFMLKSVLPDFSETMAQSAGYLAS